MYVSHYASNLNLILNEVKKIFKNIFNNPVSETAKETLMYRTVFWTLAEGEGGMIWENGIETCIISYMERVASPGLMHDMDAWGWCTGMT